MSSSRRFAAEFPGPFLALSPSSSVPRSLLSHPMSFPTPPFCLFLPLSPRPGAVFFIVGSSGLWTKRWICGKSDNEHSQTSLPCLPCSMSLTPLDGTGSPGTVPAMLLQGLWWGPARGQRVLGCPHGRRQANEERDSHAFLSTSLGPTFFPLWLLTCSLTRARTPLKELTSSRQQQKFHLRWEKKKQTPLFKEWRTILAKPVP